MKRKVIILISIAVTLGHIQAFGQKKTSINIDSLVKARNKRNQKVIGAAFPKFSLSRGKTQLTNSNLKGKIVFINFWFSACPPCIAEFDELNSMFAKFKNRLDFVFLSLTFESPEEIKRMKSKYNIAYDVFSLTRDECDRLSLNNGYPTNILVDNAGLVKYIKSGGSLNKIDIHEQFKTDIYPLISSSLP